MQKAGKKDFYDSIGTDGKAAAGMHFIDNSVANLETSAEMGDFCPYYLTGTMLLIPALP